MRINKIFKLSLFYCSLFFGFFGSFFSFSSNSEKKYFVSFYETDYAHADTVTNVRDDSDDGSNEHVSDVNSCCDCCCPEDGELEST